MKKTGLTVMFTAALALAAFSLADAQGRGRGPGGFGQGPGIGRGFMGLPGLELTDTQRDQVRAIVQQERPANAGEHQKLHRQLRAELLADSPDEQKIDTLRQQLAQARADALSHEISVQRKIAQVLTPEQRAKAREALAAEPDGRRGRRGRGPGGPLF